MSDCSSEGRQFEPELVEIKISLTQLVECHELKAVSSIPTRGTSVFNSIFLTTLKVSLNTFFSHTSLSFSCTTFQFSLSLLNKFCEAIEVFIKLNFMLKIVLILG